MRSLIVLFALPLASAVSQSLPSNLVGDGLPPLKPEIREQLRAYSQFRGAGFCQWHPERREMLISTRFAETNQLHLITQPGGARRQISFRKEPLYYGEFRPGGGDAILFSQSVGGSEDNQIFLKEFATGKVRRLTDGKSKFSSATWSNDGKRIAYISYAKDERKPEVCVMSAEKPEEQRTVFQAPGVGWGIVEWSSDDRELLLSEYISVNESRLYLLDLESGKAARVLPREEGPRGAFWPARLSPDGKWLFVVSNQTTEYRTLYRVNLASGEREALTGEIMWDVQGFDLSRDGKKLAFVTNEDGWGVLHLRDLEKGGEIEVPGLPKGSVSDVEWHRNSEDLAVELRSARLPMDVFSVNVRTKFVEQWTVSEAGPLNPQTFPETELVRHQSFDGLRFSSLVLRPDPKRWPGPRPVLVRIHGGPEGQSRPGFWGSLNYYLNELGIALVIPNVRGSSGYGKTFLDLDNGYKREDSVKDIGAVLDWIAGDPALDAERVAVTGGSYGGYMVLACMVHYNHRLRCGVESVGISNFVTFLENTRDYRRDLRRVEYGDERDEKMRAFLESISPNNHVEKIRKPLLVMQGLNDPRVPASESEQIVKALREAGGTAWYLLAKDEGHGFRKKANRDLAFQVTVQFLQEYLLK